MLVVGTRNASVPGFLRKRRKQHAHGIQSVEKLIGVMGSLTKRR
jgi:hypothetical protein